MGGAIPATFNEGALVMAAAASTKRSKETYLGVEGQEVFVNSRVWRN